MTAPLARWAFHNALFLLAATLVALATGYIWVVALVGTVSFLMLISRMRGYWTPRGGRYFGIANSVSAIRFGLTASLLLMIPGTMPGISIAGTGIIILLLDLLDGYVARKRGEDSEFGEFIDKEADAFFVLTLCLLTLSLELLGSWILAIGLMRYLFVIALRFADPPAQKERRSRWGRYIYAFTIIALIAVFVLPPAQGRAIAIVATIALVGSFGISFKWLWRQTDFSRRHRSRRASILQRPLKSMWPFWLALFALNSILLLPSFFANLGTSAFLPIPDPSHPTTTLTWTRGWYDYLLYFFVRRPNQDIFRICVDFVVLVTILALTLKRRRSGSVLRIVVIAYFVLLFYEIYEAIAFSFFHRPGIFYEDLGYILNLYYIALDTFTIVNAGRALALVALIVGGFWIIPRLFGLVRRGLLRPGVRTAGHVFNMVFIPILIGFWLLFNPIAEAPTLRSITPKIFKNVYDSVALKRTIENQRETPADPIYDSYDEVTLQTKPHVYLIMIESYGRVLQQLNVLRPYHKALMETTQDTLSRAGWYMASQFSASPVRGGLSWLSMNTLLSGIEIANKTVYTHYLSQVSEYPHLVSFFQKRGYETFNLQPPTRARPGLPAINYYDFDHTIFFDDLHYKGPSYGIWIIPDQYSLGYTHANYLEPSDKPYLLFFETASTHAPWTSVPPLVQDWQRLNEMDPPTIESLPLRAQVENSIRSRLRRPDFTSANRYMNSIAYDIEVLREYMLHDAPDNSLFIVMGDHEPPLLPGTTFNTPIHVLSRDSTLVERFTAFGFTPGLMGLPYASDRLSHAGVYSMLVDVLTWEPESPLPTELYRRRGVPPSVLD